MIRTASAGGKARKAQAEPDSRLQQSDDDEEQKSALDNQHQHVDIPSQPLRAPPGRQTADQE